MPAAHGSGAAEVAWFCPFCDDDCEFRPRSAGGRVSVRAWLVPALLVLFVAGPAAGESAGGHRGGPGDAASAVHRDVSREHLDRANQRSRQELRGLDRDAGRRAADTVGPAPGGVEAVRAARDRERAEEELDALRTRSELEVAHHARRLSRREVGALERHAGHPVGPVTRRVLERSAVEVRLADRLADVERRAREQEQRLRAEERRRPPF